MCCLYNCMRDTIKTSARELFNLPVTVIYLYNWMQWHKVLAELVPIMSPHCSLLRYLLNIFLPLYHRSTMSGERMLKKLGGCYTLVLIVIIIIIIIISGCSRTKFQQDRLPLQAHNISWDTCFGVSGHHFGSNISPLCMVSASTNFMRA